MLTLIVPREFHAGVGTEISMHLDEQLTAVVEAGGDKIFIDLSQVETPTLPVIETVLHAIGAANKLAIRNAIVASDETKAKCRGYEESQSWLFANTYEEAASRLMATATVGAH